MSYFGTDGIRGKFGEYPIHPAFLLKLGFATGQVLIQHNQNSSHRPNVVIGKDTRLSGYVVEACLQAGFNAAGVDVHMLGVIPTPAIAHLTRSFYADAGVVISASHNHYEDNGVKFFSKDGKKLPDDLQEAINQQLSTLPDSEFLVNGKNLGRHYRIHDAKGRYIEFCKGSFPYHLNLQGMKVVVDCANGAAYSVAPRVLSELGASVIAIGNTPDGVNINDQVGSTHIEALQIEVLKNGADIGLALDGDGDRIMMVDKAGKVVDGDGILYILALHGDQKPTGVVGTLMSNMGLELALKEKGVDFVRTAVGDRYVMQAMSERGWVLGGEPSGHILTLDKTSTGDAIVSALQVLAIIAKTGKSLDMLSNGYKPMPQTLINVKVAKKQNPDDNAILKQAFDDAQSTLADTGRILVRASGTEPLIRVMVECSDVDIGKAMAQELAQLIEQTLG